MGSSADKSSSDDAGPVHCSLSFPFHLNSRDLRILSDSTGAERVIKYGRRNYTPRPIFIWRHAG
jgi:hypothetical protein